MALRASRSLIGVVATTIVGVVVALPAIRTARGRGSPIVTLALSLMFNALIFTNSGVTGGFEGSSCEVPESSASTSTRAAPAALRSVRARRARRRRALVANLRRGPTGRGCSRSAATSAPRPSLGISVVGVKLYAFAVGAAIAALGGVLLSLRQTNVQFTAFNVFGSILLIQYAVIGGIAWVSGVVGAHALPRARSSAKLTSDLLPNLDNVVAWLAVAQRVGRRRLLRRAPDGVGLALGRGARAASSAPARRGRSAASADAVGDDVGRAPPDPHVGHALEVSDLSVQLRRRRRGRRRLLRGRRRARSSG